VEDDDQPEGLGIRWVVAAFDRLRAHWSLD
jgi:hypothetical protein